MKQSKPIQTLVGLGVLAVCAAVAYGFVLGMAKVGIWLAQFANVPVLTEGLKSPPTLWAGLTMICAALVTGAAVALIGFWCIKFLDGLRALGQWTLEKPWKTKSTST